ncbi:MAG: hypothetical protein WAT19_03245 [Ferruginibacter sp.]
MKKISILKLIGIVILTMLTLIACAILEVAIYSYLINPNQPMEVYQQHAKFSAPIVAGVGGFIIFFLVTRYWKRKKTGNLNQLVFLYPFVYTILDLIVVLIDGSANWSTFIYVFLLASGAKFLGSYLGAKFS